MDKSNQKRDLFFSQQMHILSKRKINLSLSKKQKLPKTSIKQLKHNKNFFEKHVKQSINLIKKQININIDFNPYLLIGRSIFSIRVIITLYIYYIIFICYIMRDLEFPCETIKVLRLSRNIFIIFLIVIYMSMRSHQASIPVTWQTTPFFYSGQLICNPTTSGSAFSLSTTYATPLTGPPAKKPSLGITDIDFQFNVPRVYMSFAISTFTATGFAMSITVSFVRYAMKIYYLAPDPTMTYQYSSFSYSTSPSAVGPFHLNYVYPTSGLTNPAVGLDMTHDVTMLPFINFMNISSITYCYEVIVRTRVYDAKHYEANVTSGCTGMTLSFIGWSRIIFDKTLIQNLGYCFFQYGKIQGLNNDASTLAVTFSPFLGGNFMMGMSQFKYTSPTVPIIMSFNTTLGDSTVVQPNTVFERLAFTYWSLKYRYCPPNYPIFHLETETCNNLCPEGTYYDPSVSMCKDCFYTCKSCTLYPACTDCDALQNRYLNGTLCLPNAGHYQNGTEYSPACSSNCIDCTNGSVCITCDVGFQMNSSSQCQSICILGCIVCPTQTTCTNCDLSSGFYLVNSTCSYCNSSLNYFISLSDLCQPCTLIGCIQCSSLTVCSVCNISGNFAYQGQVCTYCNSTNNQFINSLSVCQECSLSECIECSSLSTCISCNTTNNYYLSNQTCLYCNSTNNYFINSTNQCQLCAINYCLVCASLTDCSVCDIGSNYYLNNSICQYCNNSLNYFINMTTSMCQACSLVGCITCSSLSSCTLCNITDNYYTSGATCGYCNQTLNQFINSSSLCQQCSIIGCIVCSSLTSCTACNTTNKYYLNNSICSYCNLTLNYYMDISLICQYCNNSLNYFINGTTMQCQLCSIIGCITCSSLSSCTLCNTSDNYYLLGTICEYCNSTTNNFINPNTSLCQPCTISNCVQCLNLSICQTCNTTEGYFLDSSALCSQCHIQGCIQCLSLQQCKVCDQKQSYSITSDKKCSLCSGCNCYFQKQLSPSVPTIQYSQQQCTTFQKVDTTLSAILIISAVGAILASFTTCLIGIELIGILQLAFLNLGDNIFVHLYLSPIFSWYYVNGYNIRPKQFIGIPINIQQIGYTRNFLSNVNVMFFILIGVALVMVVVEIIGRKYFINCKNIIKILRQVFMATLLFNCLNISFSLGLQYRYYESRQGLTTLQISSLICSLLVIPLYLGGIIWITFAQRLGCGQYRQRFKQDCINQLYIPLTIIYRFFIGVYMSSDNQSDNSTLFILAISFTFIMFNITNLPYKKFYHNYRSNICHITQLVILIVTNYYRNLKKNTPISVKAQINTPAYIQISCIIICVVVSLSFALYQIFLKIRTLFKSTTKPNQIQPSSQNLNNPEQKKQSHKNQSTMISLARTSKNFFPHSIISENTD